jgi:tRNA-specific 2-thiouridylase
MTSTAASVIAPERIIVAMSGGVDSAVAALLLQRQGHDVQGLFMSNWEEDDSGYCTSAQDFQDARRVCEVLGIPLHRVNFEREYRDRVFEYFLREYSAGRTPNPDVLCNREIKFGACFDYARRLGAQRVATGHYARIARQGARYLLCKARDLGKDQSYFLHGIDRSVLPDTLFPLGELNKSEVRRLAHQATLPVFDKKDSTGICFIGERPFRQFLSTYLPARPGKIRSADGREMGEHAGLMYYTLGQRHGLGIGGVAHAPEEPWYVAGKDLASNSLIVVQGHDHALLQSEALRTESLHWLVDPPGNEFRCMVKTRYRQSDQPCTVRIDGERATVAFDRPQRAVAPGQFAVLYDGDVCLGGAIIAATAPLEGDFEETHAVAAPGADQRPAARPN